MQGFNICKLLASALVGSVVQAVGKLATYNPTSARQLETQGNVTRLDVVLINLATAGYAKNGGGSYALTGTTPVTVDLTNLATNADSTAGDTTFATVNQYILRNTGSADVTVAQGASNGASIGLAGTSPTITVPANSEVTIRNPVGWTIDATHKNLTVTPTAGGSFALVAGGA